METDRAGLAAVGMLARDRFVRCLDTLNFSTLSTISADAFSGCALVARQPTNGRADRDPSSSLIFL